MLFLSIFIFLQLFCLINCKGPSLYCPPEWVVHGSGDIPEDAEMCSLGGGEYIGRTFQNGEWVAARIIPSLGMAYTPVGNTVVETEAYQTLIFPPYCITKWVPSPLISTLSHTAVSVNDPSRTNFIGRVEATHVSPDEGQAFCGNTEITSNSLHYISPSLQTIRSTPHFEILTSSKPPLHAILHGFTFNLQFLTNTSLKNELIHSETLELNGILGTSRFNVTHSKITSEEFILSENGLDFTGLSHVDVSFHNFNGGDAVHFHVDEVRDWEVRIVAKIPRKIEASASYEITRVGAQTLALVQACSTVGILQDVEIPYTAEVWYWSPGLDAGQVEVMLDEVGRTYVGREEDCYVVGEIAGGLSGRLVFGTRINFAQPNVDFPCAQFMS
ncbi:uncharacterized protein LOC118433255 [Folsomia candida]|uniref:uncharacterized protein LOC118433255 n=1 Tax=Folsomia candida TaxID=158441 RepID=UPI001604BA9E|nr:uncharacterized protein LOC118433255 [Folsomia candida]